MIDTQTLIACGVQPTQAKVFAPILSVQLPAAGITLKMQAAGFIAQAMHESKGFTRLEESLYYSTGQRIYDVFKRLRPMGVQALNAYAKNPKALADLAYANINGNGDGTTTDGWDYRGSGLFQLTGRGNFQRCAQGTGHPYDLHPEFVRTIPEDAVTSAVWFWKSNGLNDLMQNGWFDRVSVRIVGSSDTIVERRKIYNDVMAVLG